MISPIHELLNFLCYFGLMLVSLWCDQVRAAGGPGGSGGQHAVSLRPRPLPGRQSCGYTGAGKMLGHLLSILNAIYDCN